MRKFCTILSVVLGAVFLATMASAAGDKHGGMTKHYEDSLFKVTDNGEFSVEVLLPKEGVEMGINKIDLIIHDKKDADVAGAQITVAPWMPDMNHGVSEVPRITERGGGLYSLTNVMFSMTGKWDLRISITQGKTVDNVAITLPNIGAMGHMHAMKAPDTSELDTSSEKKSKDGRFIVSYEIEEKEITVNSFVNLILRVQAPNRKPVAGADIKIIGDMPEHGHGFPTVPEVTEELGDGKYLVEGIKFSMPGWWVINFHIMSGGVMDQVNFNIVLR